jgi:MFS family permease
VIVATQLVSATALATVPLAAAMNALSIGQLYAVAFVAGLAAAFFGVAQVSFLPTLVARDRLIEANAYYQTSRTLASLIGPGLAGAAVQLLTAPITAAWLHVSEPRPGSATRRHLAREAIAGFTTLWRQPLVRSITSTLLVANAGGAMSATVLVLLFVGHLGVSPAQLGLTFAAASASSLLGSLLFRPLQRSVGVGPAMVLATALLGAGVLVRLGASFTHEPVTFPLLVGGALVSGFGLMTYNIPQQAIQQAVIPNHTLGRTTAAVALIINAGSVAASLGGGFLGQLMGLQRTLAVATAMTVLCVLPAALGPIRVLRNVPAAAADQAAG